MANRCPNCNKFVSLELEDPEVDNVEIEDMGNGKGLLWMNVSLKRNCAECGTEISTKQVEVEVEVDLSEFEPSN